MSHVYVSALRWWKLESGMLLGKDVLFVYVWVKVGTQLSEFAKRTNPPLRIIEVLKPKTIQILDVVSRKHKNYH